MATSKLVALLYETWKDFDRVIDGLDTAQAIERHQGGSSFAWTVAHIGNQIDLWVNVWLAGGEPHPYLSKREFRFGGTGAADDWDAVCSGLAQVRESARAYLNGMSDADLEVTKPFRGTHKLLKEKGINGRYAIYRIVTHHYFHIGELASKRDLIGHSVGDYPSVLEESI